RCASKHTRAGLRTTATSRWTCFGKRVRSSCERPHRPHALPSLFAQLGEHNPACRGFTRPREMGPRWLASRIFACAGIDLIEYLRTTASTLRWIERTREPRNLPRSVADPARLHALDR